MDFLDSILNNIEEALLIMDGDGKILLFNNKVPHKSEFLRLDKAITPGEYLENIAPPERKSTVRKILQRIRDSKKPEKSFAEYVDRQQVTIYLDLQYIPILAGDETLTHICLFVRDITAQKVFEKKLITEARNNSNLIEQANAIIIGVDALGYVTDWNDHCTKVSGFEKNEVFARKLDEILLLGEGYLHTLQSSQQEVSMRTKKGKKLTLLLSGTPRTTTAGEVVGFTFVGQDVTELSGYRKELEKKVEERTTELKRALSKERELVELKTRFVSIASHEFRTPLSSIQHAAEFLKRYSTRLTGPEVQTKLEKIQKQVEHMTHLLDDVLTYGKNDSGKIAVVPVSVNIVVFFRSIKEEVEQSTRGSHEILTDFYHADGKLVTDEKLLRNITINFLTNAIKFSPGKTYVELIVRKIDSDLIISIRDEGIGIHADEQDKIFEPFTRGVEASKIEGTGLGLSIAKKAVELLNGSISLDSQVGRGTTFTIIIPEIPE